MVDLFGGAIAVSVPSTWRDVSQVRQVPDNQEVFQDCTEETGAVLVFEILEYQNDIDNNSNACSFFLKDLADANEVTSLEEQQIHSTRVVTIPDNGSHDNDGGIENNMEQNYSFLKSLSLPAMTASQPLYACITRGSQKVRQGKKGSTMNAHWIDVEMCVLRLKNVETDLLISLSVPRGENVNNRGSGSGSGGEDNKQVVDIAAEHSGVFKEIVASFDIRDWSLFG